MSPACHLGLRFDGGDLKSRHTAAAMPQLVYYGKPAVRARQSVGKPGHRFGSRVS